MTCTILAISLRTRRCTHVLFWSRSTYVGRP